MKTKATLLRELIGAPEILVMPGVFDGYSGRLVARAGFNAAFITGGGISESKLGFSDMGIMGCEENLGACRNLVRCCPLPLIGDGDTGYGNALNVYFAVRAFESAGLAGLMIEDQLWPKRCGHYDGKQVISADEAAEKIRAAASARVDPEFVIKARTDAFATHGISEVISRLNLYADSGADLLFADALLSVEDIDTVVRMYPSLFASIWGSVCGRVPPRLYYPLDNCRIWGWRPSYILGCSPRLLCKAWITQSKRSWSLCLLKRSKKDRSFCTPSKS